MSLVNLTPSGNGLVKTAGCAGCADASAVSEQQFSGNGVLEFVAPEAGLAAGGIGLGAGDINFALRLQAGVAEVRESGAYRSEIAFGGGDTFQIAVEGGVVRYSKNGGVFYTSANQAAYDVRVHAVFFDMNAAVSDVLLRTAVADSAASVTQPTGADSAPPRMAQPRPAGSTPVRRRRR
jgi:hypothetical protein